MLDPLSFFPPAAALQPEAAGPRFPALDRSYDLRTYQGVDLRKRGVEFVAKMAGAHSVKDIRTMWEECSKHQVDFIRRDCDRVFKHGERLIEATSNLFKSHPLN